MIGRKWTGRTGALSTTFFAGEILEVGFFEKSSACVKSSAVRFAVGETIKYYPIPLYGRRAARPRYPLRAYLRGRFAPSGRAMCRLRGGYGTGVRPSSPVELFGGAVAGKTTVFRCKKAMIFARKSRVFDRFLHEIARFSRVFGVLFLPVRTYRTGRRPGHSLRSRCVFYRRRYCRLVCGRCGGPYPSVWPTSRNARHVQGLAVRAAILNDRGADRRRSARPAGRGLFASTTKADRRHNGKPVQSLRYFPAWDRSAFGGSAEFGAFPSDCGTMAGDILR